MCLSLPSYPLSPAANGQPHSKKARGPWGMWSPGGRAGQGLAEEDGEQRMNEWQGGGDENCVFTQQTWF